MQSLHDVLAPAKLNLFLHITGRRADGYHLLQSAFMLIDWCDTLHFEVRAGGQLSREDLVSPLPGDDLVLQSARLLQQVTGCTQGAHIQIEKRIPSQAGMGGGSSDAASCLLALNRLWGLNLKVSQLAEIGLRLGADVPFFLRGHNAWVQGVGEQITYGFGHNDLQPVAQRLCPQVFQAISWLENAGLDAKMTGSGSAVFAKLSHALSLDQSHDHLPDHGLDWQLRVCGNLEIHPLWGWASSDN
ncbi:MAG: 4-(cytidine 5'-diphospho)-2-C-methyl-D-erythritol kinase [Betaproteobacteria bacterium]|nr:4-(cytidine 5'-diphospho)-2-C-methyl-D-erythritol kinase [Betaproteobacteria bacterium]